MIPLYIDINPNSDASTTLFKEKIEYCIPAIVSDFDGDLIDLKAFTNQNIVPIFTNLSVKEEMPSKYMEEYSFLTGDYDIVAKFNFKSSRIIKAKLKRSAFTPSIILD